MSDESARGLYATCAWSGIVAWVLLLPSDETPKTHFLVASGIFALLAIAYRPVKP